MSLSVQIQGYESQWKLFLYVPHNNFWQLWVVMNTFIGI